MVVKCKCGAIQNKQPFKVTRMILINSCMRCNPNKTGLVKRETEIARKRRLLAK